uniref:ARAD1C10164p n=1 Tax=Blastobotrys adeninivorans TaxID=409370 RepID=A0A060T593_BLAAD
MYRERWINCIWHLGMDQERNIGMDQERHAGSVHVDGTEEGGTESGLFEHGDDMVTQQQGDEEQDRGHGMGESGEDEYHYVPQPYVRTRSISGASADSVTSDSTTGSGSGYATSSSRPAQSLDLDGVSPTRFFLAWPWKDIIYNNNTSEARDLDAAERNFQSLMRTALYLGLVGAVVLCNYRLPSTGPNEDKDSMSLDTKVAIPFGIIFIALSIIGLLSCFHNYIGTVTSYAKQRAEVHTHWLTWLHLAGASMVIFAATIVFLVTAE